MEWTNSEEFGRMLEEAGRKITQDNHERVAAIVAGVELEALLEESIVATGEPEARSISDKSFAGKIQVAKILGLLSSHEANDLDSVRRIRNEFAHTKEVNFSTETVLQQCENLRIPTLRPDLFDDLTPYDKFHAVVLVLSENIFDRRSDRSRQRGMTPAEIDSRRWEEFWF